MKRWTLATWLMLALGMASALPAAAQENPVTQPRLTNLDLAPAEAAALRNRIAQCWQVLDRVHALADPVVVIQAAMNADGCADLRIGDLC